MKLVISGTGDYFQGASISKLLETARRYHAQYIELWYPKNTKVEGLERSLALLR